MHYLLPFLAAFAIILGLVFFLVPGFDPTNIFQGGTKTTTSAPRGVVRKTIDKVSSNPAVGIVLGLLAILSTFALIRFFKGKRI